MKRFGRFIKWCFTSMGWFEWVMLSISFCLGAGLTAHLQGNTELKNFWFGCLLIVVGIAMIGFMIQGVRAIWERFVEHDEKVFNILKEKDLK